jgi:hypothetical protein
MFAPRWTYDLVVIDLTMDYRLYLSHTKSYSWSYSVLVRTLLVKSRQHGLDLQEVPKKKMNGRELHAHVWALFKEMTEEDRDEFLKGAEEASF